MGRRGHGEGSIYKDEARNRWVAAVAVNGKRHVVRCATKRQAVDALQRLRQAAAADRDVRVSIPKSAAECLWQWLEAKKPGLKPSTYRATMSFACGACSRTSAI